MYSKVQSRDYYHYATFNNVSFFLKTFIRFFNQIHKNHYNCVPTVRLREQSLFLWNLPYYFQCLFRLDSVTQFSTEQYLYWFDFHIPWGWINITLQYKSKE